MIKKLLLSIILLGVIVAAGGYFYYQHTISKQFSISQPLLVQSGDTLNSILNKLQQRGLIKETYTPRIYAKINKVGYNLQTGEYVFEQPLSLVTLLSNLSIGKGRQGIKVTILEGWTFKQMRERLAQEKKLKHKTRGWSDEQIMQALGYPDKHPEGYFYPETYFYKAGDSDLTIFRAAFDLMQEKLAKAWQQRDQDSVLETPYEALILASIIERETQIDKERGKIAGVFYNRLHKGMKLQTDPTVIYGLGDEYDGDIKRVHLRTDTPYNTYTRYGLPPTPISLPRYASILAAVQPTETDAIFFVATGKGGHKFSRTLAEHNRAVREYLKVLRSQ